MRTRIESLFLISLLAASVGLIPAGKVMAQTFTNLHSFEATSPSLPTNDDGAVPVAGLILAGDTLYGTASSGGTNGNGTVFMLKTNGTGFSVIHTFSALDAVTQTTNSDGATPSAGLILSGNALYGTAAYGGTNGYGTIFMVNTNGTGFVVLHTFAALDAATQTTNGDGANPAGGLIFAGNTLYGTAQYGGTNGTGTIFVVNTNGTGFATLHAFATADANGYNSDGAFPYAALSLSGNALYGTAPSGGTNGNGTVFALNTNGAGFRNLYSFTASAPDSSTNSDGANPCSGLVISGNALYGTAQYGGSFDSGTVYKLKTDGTGFTNLNSFTGGDDGANPYGGLILSGNLLYGTAEYGGNNGNGTVFALKTNGTGFSVLYAFTALDPVTQFTNSDGADPQAGLVLSGETLYGTAAFGGTNGVGTVFSLSSSLVSGSGQIVGSVTDFGGNPVVGVNVYAQDGMGDNYTNVTDGNGSFSFTVANGYWNVTVDCGSLNNLGYACLSNQTVYVSRQVVNVNFVACNQPLEITTTSLPPGELNVYYDQFLQASSCNANFTWSADSVSLPLGLHLSASGELYGNPGAGGTFSFSVNVTNGLGAWTNRSLSLTIISFPTPVLTTPVQTSSSQIRLSLGGNAANYYTLEFSTNLVDWEPLLATNPPGSQPVYLDFPTTNNGGFYRAYESGLVITDSWTGPISTAPVISFSTFVSEVDVPNSRAIVSISRSGGLANEICVNYSTADGTARGGVDYSPVSGTLCFAPNQTAASLTIPLLINANSPNSETVDLNLLNTNGTAVFNSVIVILFPQLVGTWTGTWVGTNGGIIINGSTATNVPPPYGDGTWTLIMNQVDWPDRTAAGTLLTQGTEYCDGGGFFDVYYSASQVVTNISVDSTGHVKIGCPISDLQHCNGFLEEDVFDKMYIGVDFEFDTFNAVAAGSYTSESSSTNTCFISHLGFVTGVRSSVSTAQP